MDFVNELAVFCVVTAKNWLAAVWLTVSDTTHLIMYRGPKSSPKRFLCLKVLRQGLFAWNSHRIFFIRSWKADQIFHSLGFNCDVLKTNVWNYSHDSGLLESHRLLVPWEMCCVNRELNNTAEIFIGPKSIPKQFLSLKVLRQGVLAWNFHRIFFITYWKADKISSSLGFYYDVL